MGLRILTLFAVAHAGGTALLLFTAPALLRDVLAGDPGSALLLAAGIAAVAAGTRVACSVHLVHLWKLSTVCGFAAEPVARAARTIAPQAARRAVHAAIGSSIAVGVFAAPSFAWDSPDPAPSSVSTAPPDSSSSIPPAPPSPAWPLTPSEDDHGTRTDPAWPLSELPLEKGLEAEEDRAPSGKPQAGTTHTVAEGDSLWNIVTEEHPDASDAEIVDVIAELHRDNRSVIGEDANLILPGQRLALP